MSSRLRLEPGEQVIVSTRAHPSKLWRPGVVLLVAVFLQAFLQRTLEVRWRPLDQPWVTLHEIAGWVVTLALLIVTLLAVLRPVIRWLRTRFVLSDRRLMLVGPSAPSGAVRIPLSWLVRVDARPAAGPLGSAEIGTLTADFGQAGILRLSHSPRVEQFARLIEAKAATQHRQQGSAPPRSPYGWSRVQDTGYPPAGPPAAGAAW